MDEQTRKKLLIIEYGIALATLIGISLTFYKAHLTLKQVSEKK